MRPICLLLPTTLQALTQWATEILDCKPPDDVSVALCRILEDPWIERFSEQNQSGHSYPIVFKLPQFFNLSPNSGLTLLPHTLSTNRKIFIWLILHFSVRTHQPQRPPQRQKLPEVFKEDEERVGGDAPTTSKAKRQHPEAAADKRRGRH
jgi:hypothetical protein